MMSRTWGARGALGLSRCEDGCPLLCMLMVSAGGGSEPISYALRHGACRAHRDSPPNDSELNHRSLINATLRPSSPRGLPTRTHPHLKMGAPTPRMPCCHC